MHKIILIVILMLIGTKASCQRLEDNYIPFDGAINDSLLIKCVKCIYLLKDKDSIIFIQQNEIDTYSRILENKEQQIKVLENNNEIFKKMYELEKINKPLFNNLTYISIVLNVILLTIIIF